MLAETTEGTGDSSNSSGIVLMAVSGNLDPVAAVASQLNGPCIVRHREPTHRDLRDQSQQCR